MIKPILTYNSDIWGASSINISKILKINRGKTELYYRQEFEKLHSRWCKHILGVNSKSVNIAVLAELGRYPITIEIITNIIKYWIRLLECKPSSLVYNCYRENIEIMSRKEKCWLSSVKDIFLELNLEHVWKKADTAHMDKQAQNKLIRRIKSLLKDTYHSQYEYDIQDDNKGGTSKNKLRTYRNFKSSYKIEPYLKLINDPKLRKGFTRLRISAHNLEIETGRHVRNRKKKPEVYERKCTLCSSGQVGDEYHIISCCESLEDERKDLYAKLKRDLPDVNEMHHYDLFIFIMKCDHPILANHICTFLKKTFQKRGKSF
jgi:hypothetical protein